MIPNAKVCYRCETALPQGVGFVHVCNAYHITTVIEQSMLRDTWLATTYIYPQSAKDFAYFHNVKLGTHDITYHD